MDDNDRKNLFSDAYLKAVALLAGYDTGKPASLDRDGIDWEISCDEANGVVGFPRLAVQLKCTSRDLRVGGELSFPLDVKTYDKLRPTNLAIPRILVVVVVPADVGHWAHWNKNELCLWVSAYWISLRGRPATANADTISVRIPYLQVLNPDTLREAMIRIGQGGFP